MAKKSKKIDTSNGIEGVLNSINDQYGAGSVIQGRERGAVIKCDSTSTGCLTLDAALGVWGIPRGRVCEIYGPESSGKTTLTLSIIAQAQKAGGTCAFIDAEHALDIEWAKDIGVDVDSLIINQPDCGEQAIEIAEALAKTGKVDLVVIDSVAALVPRAEIEGTMEDTQVGLQARIMSKGLRKLTSVINKSKASVVFINQIREKIGVMFGNPETTPGGRALKFYASVRMDIRRISSIKEGDKAIGNKVRVKVVKNKVAPPFTQAEFDIYFGKPVSGIDYAGSIIDMAVRENVISKNGSWFTYGNVRLGNGALAASNALRDDPNLMDEIRKKVIGNMDDESPESADADDNGFDDDTQGFIESLEEDTEVEDNNE